MRAHPSNVLFVTMVAAVVGSAGVAEAAPFVNRPLTLSRSDFALDLGLGMHHLRAPDITGFGINLELQVGLTSFLQLGVRSGLRISRDGRSTQADSFGRMFETETYGVGFDTMANPEISLRWALVHTAVELGLEGRLYLPVEDNTDVGIMVAVPLVLHVGGSARLDTGLYVPIIFADPTRTVVSLPFHLWFQATNQLYLGPMIGVRFHDPGGTSVPLGFGLGFSASYDVDLKTWLLFDDVKQNAKNFGVGGGIQVRF